MAKLTNLRQRLTCSHCGARGVYEFESSENMNAPLAAAAVKDGWVVLDDTRSCLCPIHSESVKHSSVDEIKFLGARLAAFKAADRYHLPFIVLGERLITESDERHATAAEVAMWQVIIGAPVYPAKEPGPDG
jgi:hypothetical protein